MKRRLFNLMAAVSLVLCLMIVVLWVASYSYARSVRIPLRHPEFVISWHGFVALEGYDRWADPVHYRFLGFRFRMPPRNVGSPWVVGIPHWFLTVCALAFPVARLWAFRKAYVTGSCRTCGYDLRATPGRCPECGTAVGPVV